MENGMITSGVRYNFLRIYLGINVPYISDEEIEEIKGTNEFLEMNIYPNKDSIKNINNIWVVKLCDE